MTQRVRAIVHCICLYLVFSLLVWAEEGINPDGNRQQSELIDPDERLKAANEAIRKSPNSFLGYYERSGVWRDTGQHFKAIADLGEVIRIIPDHPNSYLNRADLWRKVGDEDLADADFAEAIRIYSDKIRNSRPTANLYELRASAFIQWEKPDEAIRDYDEAMLLEPNTPRLYVSRSNALKDKGDLDKAIEDLNEAIRLKPDFVAAINNRGAVYLIKREFQRSIADFTEAIELDPNDKMLYLTYLNRGKGRMEVAEIDEALTDFDAAIRANPRFPGAFDLRGRAWRRAGNPVRALQDFNEAIHLYPEYSQAYVDRGMIWKEDGDYSKALSDFEDAVRWKPKDPSFRNTLARFRATCPDAEFRDGSKAVTLANEACESSKWKNDLFIETLAVALAETGNFDAAKMRLQQAIEMAPQSDREHRARRMSCFVASHSYIEDEPFK